MQKRKSPRHVRAANTRWRRAEERAQAERDAGIPAEPLPADDPLWAHPRVLVTPHTSAARPKWRSLARAMNISSLSIM